MVQPYGCLIVGSIAGIISTLGYDYITVCFAYTALFSYPYTNKDINLTYNASMKLFYSLETYLVLFEILALAFSEDAYPRHLWGSQSSRNAGRSWSYFELHHGSLG